MNKSAVAAAAVVAIAALVVRLGGFAPMSVAGGPPPAPAHSDVVVIGSGLAGHSAALSAADECGDCTVLLLEKEPRVGGNSMKASSGINAVAAAEQGDSEERFKDDTLRSGGGLSEPALVDTLVGDSQGALAWLTAAGVDLSGTVQLGGHTRRRTHFPPRGAVGFSIVSALAKKVEEHPNITVLAGTTATALVVEDGRVVGVRCVPTASGATNATAASQEQVVRAEAVVLATGGFGANRDLLQRHAPATAALATTNGPFAQGEGLALAQGAGAAVVDLDQVQVHPTGFVDPGDPDSGTKFLAPEKLRGVGGVLLDAAGRRFTDELATRNAVSAALSKLPGRRAFLLLGNDSAALFGPALGFYVSKGLMKRVEGWREAAAAMGLPQGAELAGELRGYNEAVAAGADAFGKSVFPATIDLEGAMYVAQVEPVVHYTMGGARIDPEGRVLRPDSTPLPGLFAAGEVTGGVHGRNRLGGNSLAECVVFGRRAGRAAAATARSKAQ